MATDKAKLDRAERLEAELKKALGRPGDVLRDYRVWLDSKNIPAERDGWPSEHAYSPGNIDDFIREQLADGD